MSNAIPLRSKTTGLVGMYPASHLDLDSDLEAVEDAPCLDCQQQAEPEAETKVEAVEDAPCLDCQQQAEPEAETKVEAVETDKKGKK